MKYNHMLVNFATIPPPCLWVLIPHEGGRDGTLPIGVRYRSKKMGLGRALVMILLKGLEYK